MKDYQNLIGKIIIALAIVVAGILIARAIDGVGDRIFSATDHLATMVRDGLLQIGSAS